ncbi:solute:Na+ symporter, SSS family [Jatrophihabitans endophyticus]|uniref:Solute:Na+ symporter, SSS family n=1 Tax=Jatrophihabitans endophyticus TaxID=1206085 RepID=A0A1M5E976_9ACTN|nr:sodium:solute symporter [Jatrophihabitans endophyticus]SHF75740.1 solute:Na+ symporter, SSS family [Jatrophihabitans endophyticus]
MSTVAAGGGVNGVELGVVVFFFVVVTFGGFVAVRWRRADSMDSLEEWGLGGRGFGTVVTWFLLGGDLYTAYTFVAVPAAMFATGAVAGFFAVPYTIVAYPIVFVFLPRLWSVAQRRGYVTPADFVRGRYDSRVLALAVALTGIVATMPYIALQLVGIQAVFDTMGLGGSGNVLVRDLPLIIAFAVLAAYTYSSGLRAPALIAFVKDTLIYIVIVVAIVYVAAKIGFDDMFTAAKTKMTTPLPSGMPTGTFVTGKGTYWAYGTLAFGSALALFMYPHSMTAVLASRRRNTIRRNTAILPAYSLMLALLALLGFAAIHQVGAGKMNVFGQDGVANAQLAVPHFFQSVFPSWFAGVAFAAIAIGALVPAAIMSIAAANLFTRNIYREFLHRDASPKQEARVSKIVSIVVKFGALLFVLGLDKQNAINMQLLGGVWILQTLVAVVSGLYTRWFHRWALLTGWAAGMLYGTIEAYLQTAPASTTKLVDGKPQVTVNGTRHFAASIAEIPFTHTKVYIGITALVINIIVAVVVTLLLRALRAPAGVDQTAPEDYWSDKANPTVVLEAERETAGHEATGASGPGGATGRGPTLSGESTRP